jgi:hypothetical protein
VAQQQSTELLKIAERGSASAACFGVILVTVNVVPKRRNANRSGHAGSEAYASLPTEDGVLNRC